MIPWLKIDNKIPEFLPNQNIAQILVEEDIEIEIRQLEHAPEKIRVTIDEAPISAYKHGKWHFSTDLDYGGHYELRARAENNQEQIFVLSVIPTKMTYNRYIVMIKEISRTALDLFIDYRSRSHERMQWTVRNDEISSFHEFSVLQAIMNRMRVIFPAIAQDPYKRPLKKREIYRIDRQMHRNHNTRPQFGPMGEVVRPDGNIYVPLDLKISHAKSDLNVHENRLLKDFLEHKLPERFAHMRKRAKDEIDRLKVATNQSRGLPGYKDIKESNDGDISALKNMLSACEESITTCQNWVNNTFLKDILPYNQPKDEEAKFQTEDLSYIDFYRNCYSKLYKEALILMPNIEQCIAKLANRKISEIYEIWSVFELTKLFIKELRGAGYRFDQKAHFYELQRNFFLFEIQKDTPIVLINKDKDIEVHLIYEPLYVDRHRTNTSRSVVTKDVMQQTPDFTIEILINGNLQHVLVFEVKYRRERDENHKWTYPKEGIEKVYVYKEQIICKPSGLTKEDKKALVKIGFLIVPLNVPVHEENDRTVRVIPLFPEMNQDKRLEVNKNLRQALFSLLTPSR
jgi:hypothetical protein